MVRSLTLVTLLVALILPGWAAKAADFTPAQSRAEIQQAVDWLIEMNEQVADNYYHTGKWDQAVEAMDRIITLRPVGTEPYASAAWLLWSRNRNQDAQYFYNRMLANNPNDPQGYFEIAIYYYFRLQNKAEALGWLQKSVARGLNPPSSHLLGHTLLQLGKRDEALAFWQQLLASYPNDAVARRKVAELSEPPAPPTLPPTIP